MMCHESTDTDCVGCCMVGKLCLCGGLHARENTAGAVDCMQGNICFVVCCVFGNHKFCGVLYTDFEACGEFCATKAPIVWDVVL